MAISTQPKGSIDGSVSFADGTGTPVTNSGTALFTKGDGKLTNINDVLQSKTIVETRGQRVGVAYGARVYPQFTVTGIATGFTAASAPGTMADWVLKRGPYSANVSTLGANRPWAFDVVVTVEGTNWGDSADHTFTLEDCIVPDGGFSWAEAEGGGNAYSLTLVCTGAITGDLAVAEL